MKDGRAFVVWFSQANKWARPPQTLIPPALPQGWSTCRIRDVVRQIGVTVRVLPNAEYKMLGVKWYGEGTFHRETVLGSEMSAKAVTAVKPGAFIYNRLFAWKESFAVVPDEHGDCFVSNEFPQFEVDESQVLAEFLYLLLLTPKAIAAVNAASVGSAAVSRNRFKESEFLQFEIPLPSLSTQRAIVAHWHKAQEEVAHAQAGVVAVAGDLNNALHALTDFRCVAHPWLALHWRDMERWDGKSARAAAFRLGNPRFKPFSTYAEEATEMVKPWIEPEHDWPVYGVNNKDGVVFSHHQKGAEFNAPYKRIRKNWFFHNPTRSAVGSLGIVPDVPADALTSPEYQVWRLKPESGWEPQFVAALIRTEWFIKLVQFHRTGAVKQRLYVENLLEVPVPDIPSKLRQTLAKRREAALRELRDARARARFAKQEVEEMIIGTRRP